MILEIFFTLLFVAILIAYYYSKKNELIDTSAIFKDLQGTTVYKIEEKDGKYRLRKTYYKIGPIYNDSPLDSYLLSMMPYARIPSWDSTYSPSIYKQTLYFDTLEEAKKTLEIVKKRDADYWKPVE